MQVLFPISLLLVNLNELTGVCPGGLRGVFPQDRRFLLLLPSLPHVRGQEAPTCCLASGGHWW